ncbi:FkbM family methyltransferase [Gordonia alkanivorans]|uniref:Methyltransferase FkbM domain-containing protein n=1 Tax=Gordonia alkanivorans NBRC 16433 TaxID=1027371 RepID=F9W268_9ACTN|nr:FkbM family methyltransferase [Gordonia alkanivorans]GAA14957.1 hypothetical protein GOALK_120_00140 [Gordonia alkanivorans NBRC 16433]
MLAAERERRTRGIVLDSRTYLDNYYGLKDRDFVVELRSGARAHVRARDNQAVGDIDILDELLIQNVYRLHECGSRVVLDVGAQAGYFSLISAARDDAHRVIAIEPSRENFDALRRNVALNPLLPIETRMSALDQSCGLGVLRLDPSNAGGHKLHRPRDGLVDVSRAGFVQATRTLCVDAALYGLEGALVKLDIEGAEVGVIDQIVRSASWRTLLMEEHRAVGALSLHTDLAAIGVRIDVLSRTEYEGEGRFQVVRLRRR